MSARDEQIAAIRTNVRDLRTDRLESCYRQVREAYSNASIIDRLAAVEELRDRTPSGFRVLTNSEARRLDHFNGDSYHWDYYCEQLGRSIAMAEERYVFQELGKVQGDGKVVDVSRPTFEAIVEGAQELKTAGCSPAVLVAPISPASLYAAVFTSLKIDWTDGEWVVLPSGQRLELFWSSAAAPIDRFVVLDRSAGEWNVKLDPETKERLTVAIGRPVTPPQAVTFLAETVVRYKVVDTNKLRVVEVVGETQDESRSEVTPRA